MIRALSHHHEEEDNNMGDITVSTAEAEVLKRQHIKHEMLDYKFYLSKQEWLLLLVGNMREILIK